MSGRRVLVGDCHELLAGMDADSVDACVTDPPYGLSFMGKRWDYDVPSVDVWREVLRVLKPGGRLLAFAGTRTMHRMWVNIEDAGFTIEDTIAWMYGSGFPKHRSKLKPAYEPVCVARKGSVSELNIDACRIATDEIGRSRDGERRKDRENWRIGGGSSGSGAADPDGRWPANVILDEEAARLLDEQSGTLTSGAAPSSGFVRNSDKTRNSYGAFAGNREEPTALYGDSGGASRFFYVAKASRSERNAGLEGMPTKRGGSTVDGFTEDKARGQDRNRPVENHHPTVKPVDLMRYLVRLVTQPGGLVLDPFTGSGTTGVATIEEGRHFIGCEIDAEYAAIAERRIANAQPSLFGAA